MIRRLEYLSYEERLKELGFSVWRRQGSRDTSLQPSNTYRELISRREINCLHGLIVTCTYKYTTFKTVEKVYFLQSIKD